LINRKSNHCSWGQARVVDKSRYPLAVSEDKVNPEALTNNDFLDFNISNNKKIFKHLVMVAALKCDHQSFRNA
jgi:hypothetical protein